MDIIFYTIGCHNCKTLEMKLISKNINFSTINDVDTVVETAKKAGISGAPILQVGDQFYDFSAAMKWVHNQN